jgi:hypothetical protein
LSRVIRLRGCEERGVSCAVRRVAVAVHRRDGADARVELRRVFAPCRYGRRKVECGLDAAARCGSQVPSVEAEVRAEARAGLRVGGWRELVGYTRMEGRRRGHTIMAARLYER